MKHICLIITSLVHFTLMAQEDSIKVVSLDSNQTVLSDSLTKSVDSLKSAPLHASMIKQGKQQLWKFLNGTYQEAETKIDTQTQKVVYQNYDIAMFSEEKSSSSIVEKVDVKNIQVKNKRDYQNILDNYGLYDFEDVTFRVQIGAYKNAESFQAGKFNQYGDVRAYTLDDDITRFTVADYSYLRQADDLKLKIRDEGYPDVFVVVFKEGKRAFDFNFEQ